MLVASNAIKTQARIKLSGLEGESAWMSLTRSDLAKIKKVLEERTIHYFDSANFTSQEV